MKENAKNLVNAEGLTCHAAMRKVWNYARTSSCQEVTIDRNILFNLFFAVERSAYESGYSDGYEDSYESFNGCELDPGNFPLKWS